MHPIAKYFIAFVLTIALSIGAALLYEIMAILAAVGIAFIVFVLTQTWIKE